MNPDENTRLCRELAQLRRGRGLDATDITMRVGPGLREVCDIGEHDTPVTVRRKLIQHIDGSSRFLPTDLRLAALAALGLHEEASGEFLDRRITWLAMRLDRDSRTARRRVDQAFVLLSQYLSEPESRVRA
jgi:hypothetical protein